jgi:hypothetical protein
MGCKWCSAELDWRNENGKNVPYEKGTNYSKLHDCPKRPGNYQPPQQQAPPPSQSGAAPGAIQKPDPPKDVSVIVGFMTVEMKNQLRAIVEESVRKVLKEGVGK